MYEIKIGIRCIEHLERPWLIYRKDGEYCQHAHCFTKKEALRIRKLIDCKRYPEDADQRYAMERLLTEDEFKRLRRKPAYYRPMMRYG